MARNLGRRDFLRQSALSAVAFSSAGALLSACGSGGNGASSTGAGIKVASPDSPMDLPLFDDNPPVDSNLEPEAGPLKIFNWDEYIWPRVVKDFAAEYDVDFEISTFYNMAEALQKVRTGQIDFDVFFPTIDFLPKLVAGELLQPLNLDYVPNLKTNIWPELADPFYDRGSRYSVPYVVYTTGIAWRTDQVAEDIGARGNPYEIFWDTEYAGKMGIYDDYREAMSMVLLKNGIADVNTDSRKHIDMVRDQLIEMADETNIRTTIDGAYAKLPEGVFAIHQAWSGDIVAAPYYMPRDEYGDKNGVLRYWWPSNGLVGNDLITIPKGAKNPVLAHHFLNFLLEDKHAKKNFGWVGYQPPLNSIDAPKLVDDGYVVPNLETAIVTKGNFDTGERLLVLTPKVDALWQRAWSDFKSGA